jgi:hypothetical protein
MADELGLRAAEGRAATSLALTALAGAFAGRAGRGMTNFASRGQRANQRLVSSVVRATHEPKNLDVSYALANMNATYQSLLLNPINQGTGGSNRTGRQISADHLRIHAFLYLPTVAVSGDQVRFMVVWDKEARGAAPVQADVLANVANQVTSLNSAYQFDNVPTRFTVLFDRKFNVIPRFSGQIFAEHFEVEVPLKGRRAHFYNTTGSGVADIDSGSIYAFWMGYAAADFCQLSFESRLVFRDL